MVFLSGSSGRLARALMGGSAALALAACNGPMDFDLRGKLGGLNTAPAAAQATAKRPSPDDRGVISYPNYQVAVARRGDRVRDVAARVGLDANALASNNGLKADDPLNAGHTLILPARVAEPSPATGSPTTGPIQPPGVDISALAGGAIDRAGNQQVATTTLPPGAKPAKPKIKRGLEPKRHKVTRGETAYTIARLYDVPVRSLAEWNGLDKSFSIREGQTLLIPAPKLNAPVKKANTKVNAPGAGSPTPTPPSASKPLPREATKPVAQTTAALKKPVADLGRTQTSASKSGRFAYPVQGKIIRAYKKGKNDGIDIAAAPGTAIKAAEAGTIVAITADQDQVPIIVVKHPRNLLTVYANVAGIKVKKGARVKRGQTLATIRSGKSAYVHFEVRKGFESVDPLPYLQ